MAPRSIWSGAISFGLVNIPIKLVTAVRKQNVSFRELRGEDNSRIRHKKVAQEDGEIVEQSEIVKGYEIAPDRYVVISPEELKALNPKASRSIDLEDFVDIHEIDPIFFDSPYYLLPEPNAMKPYKLLHEALVKSEKVGIARFVLRSKQYLAAIRPIGDALAVSTMVYDDEVIKVESFADSLPGDDVEVSDREVLMAEQLIESLTSDWTPEKYKDTYREEVLGLIEQKAAGEEIVAAPEAERESGDVVDLMAALEASLKAAKGGEGDKKKKRKPAKKSA